MSDQTVTLGHKLSDILKDVKPQEVQTYAPKPTPLTAEEEVLRHSNLFADWVEKSAAYELETAQLNHKAAMEFAEKIRASAKREADRHTWYINRQKRLADTLREAASEHAEDLSAQDVPPTSS